MKNGKKVKLKIYNNLKIFYGTIDYKDLKSVYITIQSWATPKMYSDNWKRIVLSQSREIKHTIFDNINDKIFYENIIVDLDVRLLDLDTGYSILVVRGKANEPLPEIKSKTQIVGRLYPRQNVDRAFPKPGELSRIDPALVVSEQTPFLYDGYIVLKSEKLTPQLDAAFSPIPSPQISQRITTFYWQHISYVVVWWFMAVLLLIAPLFPQFRAPKVSQVEQVKKPVKKQVKRQVKKQVKVRQRK